MTIFNPMIDIAVKGAMVKATGDQLRTVEEKLEALAEHTLYVDDQDVVNVAIDFGAQMSVYKRYELVRMGRTIYGFAGDPEQVLIKILATINS